MASGELTTEMIFAPETGGTLKLNILQFASRSIPSLVCQEVFAIPSADMEIDFVPRLDHSGVPGSVYMQDAPDDTDFALVKGPSKWRKLKQTRHRLIYNHPWSIVPEARIVSRLDGNIPYLYAKGRAIASRPISNRSCFGYG